VPASPEIVALGALVGDDLTQGLGHRALGKEVAIAKDLSWDLEGDNLYVNDFHEILLSL
jgi:hypothetical protein